MKGEDVNSLQPKELTAIKKALQNGQINLVEKIILVLKVQRIDSGRCSVAFGFLEY
jgi:hypothetical protein